MDDFVIFEVHCFIQWGRQTCPSNCELQSIGDRLLASSLHEELWLS